MRFVRHIPGFALFFQPTAAEHSAKRTAEAEQLAEHHRQRATELGDQAAWCVAQQAHHDRMAEMYRRRSTVVQMPAREGLR